MKKVIALIWAVLISIFYFGCANFKELKPKPELVPTEGNYIEIKDKDEPFELKAGKKYFIKIPPTSLPNFYFIVKTDKKNKIKTFFSDFWDDGKGQFEKIIDEGARRNDVFIYPIEANKAYYFAIEEVLENLKFTATYRYVPRWRFKFEDKYSVYKITYDRNRASRTVYEQIGPEFNFLGFNFTSEISDISNKITTLSSIQTELKDLRAIFPPEAISNNDSAFVKYAELSKAVDLELEFQKNYKIVLEVFEAIKTTSGNFEAFIAKTPLFLSFYDMRSYMPSRIFDKASAEIRIRFLEAPQYYKRLISNKKDILPIEISPDAESVKRLYLIVESSPNPELSNIFDFIGKFNKEATGIENFKKNESALNKKFEDEKTWPSNSFYPEAMEILKNMRSSLPKAETAAMPDFNQYSCVQMLYREIVEADRKTNFYSKGFPIASENVPKINEMKLQENYGEIIELLHPHKEFDFWINQYPDLDDLFIQKTKDLILRTISNRSFAQAENIMRGLFAKRTFLNEEKAQITKMGMLRQIEIDFTEMIKKESKERIDSFWVANVSNYNNVKQIYEDSAFTPVYTFSFSIYGEGFVSKRNNEILSYIDEIKYYIFPEKAIETIYKDFVRNINDKGVQKTRAILEHGKLYRGDNKKIRGIVAECDPMVPKLITEPKKYRELYAIPITDNENGVNEYVIRIRLNIPSDAKFPVFDVNIRVAEEVARNAASQQWYDKLIFNNNELKQEGRIKISAPVAANNFEAQISPVQIDAKKLNILEIRFKYRAYKVFQFSAMAQVPIIKKN